ncbi:galactose-6-phosphate isomerase subunit LacA [Streptococcus fryi]
MRVIIGADKSGTRLKNIIREFLKESNYDILDVSDENKDFVDNTLAVVDEVLSNDENLGIMIDGYGVGPFMTATKVKGMVVAEVSDERSAYMTRSHNNSRMITMGSEIVGEGIAQNIVKGFLEGQYDGGRHQIRVDMLNKMC